MSLRFCLFIGVSIAISAAAPSAQSAQRFRTSVDVIVIQASVKDSEGRPVRGLTAADFEVLDNGVAKPVLSLQADTAAPLSLAILVDMSGSMAISSKRAMARQTFHALLSHLRHGVDEVAVFTFDAKLHERQPFTQSLERLGGALDDFQAFGNTSLYDAVDAAARRLNERSTTHQALVVLTDGIDTSSTLTAAQVSSLANSIGVPVYIVATMPGIDRRTMLDDRAVASDAADLRDLAAWSAGELAFVSSDVEITSLASRLIDGLRQQYVLAIAAGSGREWRRVEVKVKRPSAIVKARTWYRGGQTARWVTPPSIARMVLRRAPRHG
jgi:Ca-activated chloride channel homolog